MKKYNSGVLSDFIMCFVFGTFLMFASGSHPFDSFRPSMAYGMILSMFYNKLQDIHNNLTDETA